MSHTSVDRFGGSALFVINLLTLCGQVLNYKGSPQLHLVLCGQEHITHLCKLAELSYEQQKSPVLPPVSLSQSFLIFNPPYCLSDRIIVIGAAVWIRLCSHISSHLCCVLRSTGIPA